MRADRLVAILLLLQARTQVTAAEVAAELEISERTARRDLDALSVAGVPVYSKQGRNGGWQLVGGAKTDLSGLTAAEARALFLVAGTASSTPEVKAALRKLVRALPETFRTEAEAASNALVVDPTAWGRSTRTHPTPTHLDALTQAVVNGEQVVLGYATPNKLPSTRVVHPLGLATKGPVWYLVADTDAGLRTFRVDRVTSTEPTGDPVVRPEGFDLEEAWRLITDTVDARAGTARPKPAVRRRPRPSRCCGWSSAPGSASDRPGPTGGSTLRSAARHNEALAGELAGFGAGLEVLEPTSIRTRLARIATELTTLYVET